MKNIIFIAVLLNFSFISAPSAKGVNSAIFINKTPNDLHIIERDLIALEYKLMSLESNKKLKNE